MSLKQKYCLYFISILLLPRLAWAEQVKVAVATNFVKPMQAISQAFEQSSEHKVQLSFASSGKFYAQIRNGAPYHVFLSADQDKPNRLVKDKLALADSQFTYALGTLVLWSRDTDLIKNSSEVLQSGQFNKLALANPKLAPFGVASIQVMDKLGLKEQLLPRLVRGENVAQAFQFIASGNAELGFIALAQILENGEISKGSAWIVPPHLHEPIRQDAILLKKGTGNSAALALLEFIKTPQAQGIIQQFGYRLVAESGSL